MALIKDPEKASQPVAQLQNLAQDVVKHFDALKDQIKPYADRFTGEDGFFICYGATWSDFDATSKRLLRAISTAKSRSCFNNLS